MRALRINPFGLPVLLVTLIGLTLLYFALNLAPDTDTDAARAQVAAAHSPEKQAQREDLIARMQARGIIGKVEPRDGSLARVWTGPAFDGLDFDAKQSFVGVVYAYCFDGQSATAAVIVHDGRTGKKIGSMTKYGLRMN